MRVGISKIKRLLSLFLTIMMLIPNQLGVLRVHAVDEENVFDLFNDDHNRFTEVFAAPGSSYSITAGDLIGFDGAFTPEEFTYSVEKDEIASANESGEIQALVPGWTNMVVTAGEGVHYLLRVFVADEPTRLEFAESEITMGYSESREMEFIVEPESARYCKKTFEVNSDVDVYVSQDPYYERCWIITDAAQFGEAVVTVTAANDISGTTHVTVENKQPIINPSFYVSNLYVELGVPYTINALDTGTIYYEHITYCDYDTSALQISDDGTVTGYQVGNYTVHAVLDSGEECWFSVAVTCDSLSVQFAEDEVYLLVGDGYTAEYRVEPELMQDCEKTFDILDGWGIADITQDGYISAMSVGDAVARVTLSNGAFDTMTIHVVEALTFNHDLYIPVNGEYQITTEDYSTYPEDPSQVRITYSDYSDNLIHISEDGLITVNEEGMFGSTFVNAVTENGRNCGFMVYVYAEPESIDVADMYIKLNHVNTLSVNLQPYGSESCPKTYTVIDGEDVVLVDEYGNISACKAGTATIRVETANGLHADATVTVLDGNYADYISFRDIYMQPGETYRISEDDYDYSPEDISDDSFTYECDGDLVISDDGVITAPDNACQYWVRVRSAAGCESGFSVFVAPEPESFRMETHQVYMTMTSSKILKTVTEPLEANTCKKTYEVISGQDVVSVDPYGNLYPLNLGDAVVRVTTMNDLSDTAEVHVIEGQFCDSFWFNNITLDVGATYQITEEDYTVYPEDCTDERFEFTDYDHSLIDISDDGVITSLGQVGTTYVNVYTVQCGYNSFLVEVVNAPKEIHFRDSEIELQVGESTAPSYDVYPEEHQYCEKTFEVIEGQNVVDVDYWGNIYAVSTGTAKVQVTTYNGKSDIITVNVTYPRYANWIAVRDLYLKPGQVYQITEQDYDIDVPNAVDEHITFVSNAANILTISEDGVVTVEEGVTGNVNVTAYLTNGFSSRFTIHVADEPEEIILPDSEIFLPVGGAKQIQYTTIPESAAGCRMTYELVTGEEVVSLTQNGYLTAITEGEAVIRISADNGCCAVLVVRVGGNTVEYIEFNEICMYDNESYQISENDYNVYPEDSVYTLSYSGYDTNIIQISEDGVITPVQAGITWVTANYGFVNAEFVVHVQPTPKDLYLYTKELEMMSGDICNIDYEIEPYECSGFPVTFSVVDGEGVVEVDDSGRVHALTEGQATIAVETNGLRQYAHIVVKQAEYADYVEFKTIYVQRGTIYQITDSDYVMYPQNPTKEKLTFSIYDPYCATITKDGLITAFDYGTTQVTARSAQGQEYTFNLVVYEPAESIDFTWNEINAPVGKGFFLAYETAPYQGVDLIDFEVIQGEDVVNVSEEGWAYTCNYGTAVVRATTVNGHSAEMIIYVKDGNYYSSIEMNDIYLTPGSEYQITSQDYRTIPESAEDDQLLIGESDFSEVEISSTGHIRVSTQASGSYWLSVRTPLGVYGSCRINVSVEPEEIAFAERERILLKGMTYYPNFNVLPSDAEACHKTYTIDNPEVIQITNSGEIYAAEEGDTYLTVETDNGLSDRIPVHVIDGNYARYIYIYADTQALSIGESLTMRYEMEALHDYVDPEVEHITWKSSAPSVATVDEEGHVFAKAAGDAKITATITDGSTASMVVFVSANAKAISATEKVVYLEVDEQHRIGYEISPRNAGGDPTLDYLDESQSDIVELLGGTQIRGRKIGETKLIMQTGNCVDTVIVRVTAPEDKAFSAGLYSGPNAPHLDIAVGKSVQIPWSGNITGVKWYTSNSRVAVVNETGLVSFVGYGNVDITAVRPDGVRFKESFIVAEPVSSIYFAEDTYYVSVDHMKSLSLIVEPYTVHRFYTDEVTFEVEDPEIATTSMTTVTGRKAGETTVSVTDSQGNTSTAKLIVIPEQYETYAFALNCDKTTLKLGEETVITPGYEYYYQGNAAVPEAEGYFSDNEEVVTVDENGCVTAKGPGKAKVFVTLPCNEIMYKEFTVLAYEEDFRFLSDSYVVGVGDEFYNKNMLQWFKQLAGDAWNVVLSTDRPDILDVGSRTAIAEGDATLYASIDGYVAETTIHVISSPEAPKAIRALNSRIQIRPEYYTQMQIEIDGDLADNNVTWISSNVDVAEIRWVGNKYAYVYGKKPGNAIVVAASQQNPNIYTMFTVTVTENAEIEDQTTYITVTKMENGTPVVVEPSSANAFTLEKDGEYYLSYGCFGKNMPTYACCSDGMLSTLDGFVPVFRARNGGADVIEGYDMRLGTDHVIAKKPGAYSVNLGATQYTFVISSDDETQSVDYSSISEDASSAIGELNNGIAKTIDAETGDASIAATEEFWEELAKLNSESSVTGDTAITELADYWLTLWDNIGTAMWHVLSSEVEGKYEITEQDTAKWTSFWNTGRIRTGEETGAFEVIVEALGKSLIDFRSDMFAAFYADTSDNGMNTAINKVSAATAAGTETEEGTAYVSSTVGLAKISPLRVAILALDESEGADVEGNDVWKDLLHMAEEEESKLQEVTPVDTESSYQVGQNVAFNVIDQINNFLEANIDKLAEIEAPVPEHTYEYVSKPATCTEDGYENAQICTDCGDVLSPGTVIKATGHKYNNGVVTTRPTTTETGIMTYTCTVCGDSYTEEIPMIEKAKVPTATLSVAKGSAANKLVFTGAFAEYADMDKYTITEHGILYIQKTKLGAKTLTLTTSGRTKVSFSAYKADGSFTYTLNAAAASTKYVVRSYISYTDENGKVLTVYSPEECVKYNGLK